jgi:hypothetical protein
VKRRRFGFERCPPTAITLLSVWTWLFIIPFQTHRTRVPSRMPRFAHYSQTAISGRLRIFSADDVRCHIPRLACYSGWAFGYRIRCPAVVRPSLRVLPRWLLLNAVASNFHGTTLRWTPGQLAWMLMDPWGRRTLSCRPRGGQHGRIS